MADDLSNRGGSDRSRINVNEPHELRYWCQKLGCTETQLKQAIREVGIQASAVESYLRSHAGSSAGSQR
jgi:hypothetical protein